MSEKLSEMLEKQIEQNKSDLDVLKELFILKDVESKTDLTIQQIILLNQKRTIANLLGWDSLDKCLNDFMILLISLKRKGRGEFVEGFKSERDKEKQGNASIFQNFRDRLSGR